MPIWYNNVQELTTGRLSVEAVSRDVNITIFNVLSISYNSKPTELYAARGPKEIQFPKRCALQFLEFRTMDKPRKTEILIVIFLHVNLSISRKGTHIIFWCRGQKEREHSVDMDVDGTLTHCCVLPSLYNIGLFQWKTLDHGC
jgi:hypothetical protein